MPYERSGGGFLFYSARFRVQSNASRINQYALRRAKHRMVDGLVNKLLLESIALEETSTRFEINSLVGNLVVSHMVRAVSVGTFQPPTMLRHGASFVIVR